MKDSTWKVGKRILSYTKPYGGYLAGGLVCAVISVLLSLWLPVLIGNAVDQIIGPGQVRFSATPKTGISPSPTGR